MSSIRTPDESRSVTRQIAHAKAYAQRRGWTVDIGTDQELAGSWKIVALGKGFF